MRCLFLLILFGSLAGAQELALNWREVPASVAFGQRFELVLERRYSVAAQVVELDLQELLPLDAEIVARELRQFDEQMVETLRLSCRAFVLDELRLEAITMRGELQALLADVTAPFAVESEPLSIKIEGLLRDDDPGEIEGPPGPLPWEARSSILPYLWLAIVLILIALAVAAIRRRLGGTRIERPALRVRVDAVEQQAGSPDWSGAVSRLLRDELADRAGPDEPERDSEDWRRSGRLLEIVGPVSAARLGDLLARLDQVVYADLELDVDEQRDLAAEVDLAVDLLSEPPGEPAVEEVVS